MSPYLLEAVRLIVWLVLLTALFIPLERLFGVRRQPVFRRQFGADLGYYFLNSLFSAAILAALLAFVAAAAHRVVPWSVTAFTARLPFWPALALSLLIAEIGFYWGHRLSHEVPLLWRFHAVHHSAEDVDFLTNTRLHPVDMIFTRLCGFVPLYVVGLTPGAGIPALIVIVATIWGFFIHANIRWRLGWLEWLIATPGFHRWHHTNSAERDRNYAPLFPLVDWVFGTLYLPKTWPEHYGIDDPLPQSLGGQLVRPFTSRREAAASSAS